MLMKISREAPDEEFSLAAQYRTPMMFLAGIKHEAMINKIADFDALQIKAAPSVREELEEWLLWSNSVRLVPVK